MVNTQLVGAPDQSSRLQDSIAPAGRIVTSRGGPRDTRTGAGHDAVRHGAVGHCAFSHGAYPERGLR